MICHENCDSCGKSFSGAGTLKKHIHAIREGHKYYECEYCGKSFSGAGTLKKHIQAIRENNSWKDYNCEICL